MSVTDPIADAITKIRNAYRADHKSVTVNHSKITEAVIKILAEENFINSYVTVERNPAKKIYRKMIFMNLRYTNSGEPVMVNIQRISRPGLRIYKSKDQLPKVLAGLGIAIVSTSNGVMTDRAARAIGHGGEVICTVC